MKKRMTKNDHGNGVNPKKLPNSELTSRHANAKTDTVVIISGLLGLLSRKGILFVRSI